MNGKQIVQVDLSVGSRSTLVFKKTSRHRLPKFYKGTYVKNVYKYLSKQVIYLLGIGLLNEMKSSKWMTECPKDTKKKGQC